MKDFKTSYLIRSFIAGTDDIKVFKTINLSYEDKLLFSNFVTPKKKDVTGSGFVRIVTRKEYCLGRNLGFASSFKGIFYQKISVSFSFFNSDRKWGRF